MKVYRVYQVMVLVIMKEGQGLIQSILLWSCFHKSVGFPQHYNNKTEKTIRDNKTMTTHRKRERKRAYLNVLAGNLGIGPLRLL